MNDLVSVIMPSYNTEAFILEAVKSVLRQTYKNWELLIVDDCSKDHTEDMIRSLKDSRIVFIRNRKNCGAALSRNKALSMAKGRWIAFLDSDDIWHPDKLEKQIAFMEEHNYTFSYTEYEEFYEQNPLIRKKVSGPKRITRRKMLRYCWPGCLTVMYDRMAIGAIQITDMKKNNDYAMWLRVSEKADCYLLEEVLAYYRRREGSISSQSYRKLIVWHYRLFRQDMGANCVAAGMYTFVNLVNGIYKKLFYVKKIPEVKEN